MKGTLKETEVGLIPKDWEVKKIKFIAPLQRGFDLPSNQIRDGKYPIIYSNGKGTNHRIFKVKGPGLVTGRSGTIGNLFYIEENFFPHNTTLWVTKFINVFPKFIYYLYSYIDFKKFSSGSGVPTLNRNDVHDFSTPLPPTLAEQEAIATVLSDTDAWIESLEAQIEKKKLIKQGTMQELLTGKRRLPGIGEGKGWKDSEVGRIPEDWEVKRLGDVVTFLDGKRKPIKDSDRDKMRGDFPYYGASGIIDYVNGYLFDEDLILLGEDGDNILSRNTKLAFKVNGKIWVNNHAHVLRPNAEFNLDFLVELLESLDYELYNSGTAQPKLNQKTCKLIPIPLPTTLAEQDAIALILSEMDEEIEVLEQKVEKAKGIKQGLMQVLLTGKIRLV